jgi:uncharacterized protein YjbI with pentapeptide repeats
LLAISSAKTIGYLVLVCAVLLALAASILLWPKAMVPGAAPGDNSIDAAKRVELENGARTSLVSGVALLSVLGAAAIAWSQFASTQSQLRLTLQQQQAESYSRTIELLDADESYIRYAGVVQLERLVEELDSSSADITPGVPLSVTQIELVLARFVQSEVAIDSGARDKEDLDSPLSLRRYHPDVATAISVIAEINARSDVQIDLREVDIRGASLTNTDLHGVNLARSKMQYSDSRNPERTGPSFAGATLSGASIGAAELPGADFTGAVMVHTHMAGAGLQKACFAGTDLSQAYRLDEAALSGATYSASTAFPPDFTPKDEGMVLVSSGTTCARSY